jgi:hypothetical protein
MLQDGFYPYPQHGNFIVKPLNPGGLLKVKLLLCIQHPGVEAVLSGVLVTRRGAPLSVFGFSFHLMRLLALMQHNNSTNVLIYLRGFVIFCYSVLLTIEYGL